MAKYLIDSTDIEIEEVSGTQNLKFNFASGNSLETQIGDLSNLTTPVTTSIVDSINSIIISGSNANGSYIKFSDGTMICYNTQTFNAIDCSYSWGSIYTNNNDKRNFNNFPETFISAPTVTFKMETGSADAWLFSASTEGGATTTFPGGWQIARATTSSSINVTLSYIAIGKWE